MNESLKSSVGPGRANDPQDVSIVQYLLNAAMDRIGSLEDRLEVDGIYGPKTLAAIKTFQRDNCKVVDGIVDPNMETITRLNQEAGHFISLNDGRYLEPRLPPKRVG
jgi:peptidoglycan hydrolase-like protein with peptidoglycan-binding domain